MSKIVGILTDSSVIIPNIEHSRMLYKMGFYGKFIGYDKVKPDEVDKISTPLQLSLIEALYLVEKGILEVYRPDGSKVSIEELYERGRRYIKNFDKIYQIYRYFRDRGYVVKSGLKFGALFAIYERGPGIDHAPMLIHFIDPDRDINALDITRAARLSHSVNKRFVLATWNRVENRIDLVAFEWWTP